MKKEISPEFSCNKCAKLMCNDCYGVCSGCGDVGLCTGCTRFCDYCDEEFCGDCYFECDRCGERMCYKCVAKLFRRNLHLCLTCGRAACSQIECGKEFGVRRCGHCLRATCEACCGEYVDIDTLQTPPRELPRLSRFAQMESLGLKIMSDASKRRDIGATFTSEKVIS